MTSGVRSFSTGATRSADAGRYDPEAFLAPIVIERFSEYMQAHRVQPDGSIREGCNWQKGIPQSAYMKGMWRHMLHLWTRHRGYEVQDPMAAKDAEEDLCALLFNVQGMLFEMLKDKRRAAPANTAGVSLKSEEEGDSAVHDAIQLPRCIAEGLKAFPECDECQCYPEGRVDCPDRLACIDRLPQSRNA